MTGQEIVNRTLELGRKCVYWYGAKRQIPTEKLAQILRKNNPSVWTMDYLDAARADIGGTKLACDCSGLVCGAYAVPDIGTSQFPKTFTEYTGISYITGMIAWKKGHCGIIIGSHGTIAEMRGLKWDFCTRRTFSSAGFTKIFYDPRVTYEGFNDNKTGWVRVDSKCKWQYIKPNGKFACGEFLKIDGKWYYFNADYYMVTGYFRVNGKRYCSTENGLLKSGAVISTDLEAYELIH